MKKSLPWLVLFGSIYSIYRLFQIQQREIRARQWDRAHPRKALITGASSGIGAEFASALAREGYHLILLARREDRLRQIAEMLGSQYGVQVDVLVADLSNHDDLERAAQAAGEIEDLDLLVNNAGYSVRGTFLEAEQQKNLDMVQVNLYAAVRMARAVLPGMVRRDQGGIINVSSVAGFLPSAGNHTYGATKAYLNFFTESLYAELEGTGVRVQALCPGYTHSEFHDTMGVSKKTIPPLLWLNAKDVVAESLRGLREGRLFVVPGLIYKLAVLVLSIPGTRPLVQIAERLLRFRRFSRPSIERA